VGAREERHRLGGALGAVGAVGREHEMALVAHDAAHLEPAPAREVGEAARFLRRAAAARKADVHVDEHLAHSARGRGRDGILGVHRDGDARIERAEAARVHHLVREEQVAPQPCGREPLDLADRRAGEVLVAERSLAPRERRALVRLHVRAQPGPRQRGAHRTQVRVERRSVDDERRGRELVELHPPVRARMHVRHRNVRVSPRSVTAA
jgi:hypothetical protein